ncbi:MAG TPA: hypothetical protein VFL60_07715 [Gaiellaceae bacterium]|nr:hypothetical protein [Gaiellaceae bacterium]
MRRLLLVIAGLAAAAAVGAGAARATNECRGLMVCVPVAGPWVLTGSSAQVQYQLSCPKNFIVAGLDAELSVRGIDVGFVGALGSPVNPGITTTRDAVFLGRLVRGRTPAASFRPHIGCVPASGGGQRTPTAYHAYAPGKPVDRRVLQVAAAHDRTVTARCPKGERLAGATHAVGFFGAAPPTAAAARSVHVTRRLHGGAVTLVIRSHVPAVVQLSLLCAAR